MKIVRKKLIIIVLICTLAFDVLNNIYASETKIINGINENSNILLWSDEFNEKNINNNFWKVISEEDIEHGFGSAETSWNFKSELCEEREGCLVMKSQMLWDNNQNSLAKDNQSIGSSRIISKNLIECKYGRIDIRAKLAKGQGIWSMCYLLGNNMYGNWPYCGEMDFWECTIDDNPQIYQAAMSKEFNSILGNEKAWKSDVQNVNTQFHLYSIEWSENNIKFYIDNKLTGCYDRSLSPNKEIGKEYEEWPFDTPFYFVIDCRPKQVSKDIKRTDGWTKISENGDNYTYEDSMYIDYIRIYSLSKEEQTTTSTITQSVNKKPAKVKIKLVKRIKKNRILVKFKKVKNAKKYEIQYASNKKFKKAKIKTTKKYSYTIKKLSKKKTYYIRVRGVNGTKKGTWSKIKKIKRVKK